MRAREGGFGSEREWERECGSESVGAREYGSKRVCWSKRLCGSEGDSVWERERESVWE